MIRASWSTFRDRWQLFVGAIVATAIGVALVQASLLTLLSAVHPHVPPGTSWHDELVIREGYAGAVSLAAIMMAISTFVAVFVVSSTFAFTVAQRRRDFALLRLIGAQPRHVRRLVRGEALTLGAFGAGLGVPLGRIVAEVQRSTFVRLDLVPADFGVAWHWWIVAVGVGVGVSVAIIGAGAASRRAARARPLDALSSAGIDDAVMGWLRWLLGVLAGLGTVALIVVAPLTGSAAGIDTSIGACLVSVVALTALAPAAIPRLAALIQRSHHRGHRDRPLTELVHANLRDGIRRSASTASPIILLVGLVVGLAGSLDVIGAGQLAEARRTIDADLAMTASQPIQASLDDIDDIAVVSEEAPLLVRTTLDLGEAGLERLTAEALLIDPADYSRVHDLGGIVGDLGSLDDDSVAVGHDHARVLGVDVGDTIPVEIGGTSHELVVAAVLPRRLDSPDVVLSQGITDSAHLERTVFVQLVEGVDSAAAIATIAQITGGAAHEIRAFDAWAAESTSRRRGDSRDMVVAILTMSTLYIVIAIINAVVISAGDRRDEFATERLSGLTRAMVVRATVLETAIVATIGVLLGTATAAATLLGVTAAVSAVVGTFVFTVPWQLFALTATAAVGLATATSMVTAVTGTRRSAISLTTGR